MKNSHFAWVFVACCGMITAQVPVGLSGDISPQSGFPGTNFTITVTARGGPVDVNGCVVADVRQGSPAGPVVFAPFCIAVIQTIQPCQTLQGSWDGTDSFGAPVPPGDYFVRTSTFQGDFFWPIRLDGTAPRPVLTAQNSAQIGQPLVMSIAHPTEPNAFYLTAASFTTNFGFQVTPTEFLALDTNDLLFSLTFPNPDPILFGSMQGTLDGNGNANGIGMFIPAVPFLQCAGMAWQAAVVGNAGIQMTNTIHFTIQ